MDCKRPALIALLTIALTACEDDLAKPAQPAPSSPPPVEQTQPPASVIPPAADKEPPVDKPALPAEPAPVNPTPEPPAPAEHKVTLSWQVPATRESGDPLTLAEIAGFEIYFYEESCGANCESTISVDKDTFSQAMTLSDDGLWHFAMAVIDINGLKSELSNLVSVPVGS